MAKHIEMTQKIRDLITSATEGGTDPDTVTVFEAISLNGLPVNKRNVFEGATHPENTLREMAAVVSTHPLTSHVPVHVLHDQGYGLPVGKVFHGEYMQGTNGVGEVRSLFFLPNTETALLGKLESSAIEEVSVGLRYKHLNCSQCGWDYMSDEATMDNFWDRECGNGHAIGTDGVHLVCNGLDRWMEQSLVSLGAAQGAKIVSRTKSLLGNESYTALAASGMDPSVSTLYATLTLPKEKPAMDMTLLIENLTTAKASILAKDSEILTLKASVASLGVAEAALTAAKAEVEALKSNDVLAVKAERDAAFAFVREEADRLCVAAGTAKLAADAKLETLTASIADSRTKLLSNITPGGVSEAAFAGTGKSVADVATASHAGSFSTK